VNNYFKSTSVQKFSRIKVHNALALPIRLYGSEIWTLKKEKDKKRLTSIEMKFQKNSRVRPFEPQKYKEILEQLKVEPADKKLRRCKSNWLLHVTRMNSDRKPRIMLNCRPWKKTTWKTFEETFRRGRNRSIRA
jgi:hypothetical protein